MSKKFEDGIYHISNDEYHSSEGLSRSALWEFNKTPYHYWYRYLNPEREAQKATPAMQLGTLVHTMILEPHLLDEQFKIKPEIEPLPALQLLKDVGREAYDLQKEQRQAIADSNAQLLDEFNDSLEGHEIITQDTYEQALAMKGAHDSNQDAVSLTKNAKVEQSIYFTHEETGLQVKARPDAWLGSIVTDVKTCQDASQRSFEHEAVKYGYYLQAGIIHEALKSVGVTMDDFCFSCVEKKAPFSTAIYALDDEAIQYGVDLFEKLIREFAKCKKENYWPSYGLKTINVAQYLLKEVEL